jgi:hypothetical protein
MKAYVRNDSDRTLDIWWAREPSGTLVHEGQLLPHRERPIHESPERLADFRKGEQIYVTGKLATGVEAKSELRMKFHSRNLCRLRLPA